jgi:hypothetical protein
VAVALTWRNVEVGREIVLGVRAVMLLWHFEKARLTFQLFIQKLNWEIHKWLEKSKGSR